MNIYFVMNRHEMDVNFAISINNLFKKNICTTINFMFNNSANLSN